MDDDSDHGVLPGQVNDQYRDHVEVSTEDEPPVEAPERFMKLQSGGDAHSREPHRADA